MVAKTEENLSDKDKDPKYYEIGYLLAPFIGEADKDAAVAKEIKVVIESAAGRVAAELSPSLIPLAYPIRKMIENKYSLFRDAYFGTVKFEAGPAAVVVINSALLKSESLIRFLLIETNKNTDLKARTHSLAAPSSRRAPISFPVASSERIVPDAEKIDKEIDDLLVASS